MGLPPYSSSSQQLVRYGGNSKAYNLAPSASPMYPHMINPAGDSNLNGMLHVMPTHNLSPRGGILPGQRTDLPYDDPAAPGHHPAHPHHGHPSQRAAAHHQYSYNDNMQDWYGGAGTSKHQQPNSSGFDSLAARGHATAATLLQDDYQKEKMFSEFFTQVLCPPQGGGNGAGNNNGNGGQG